MFSHDSSALHPDLTVTSAAGSSFLTTKPICQHTLQLRPQPCDAFHLPRSLLLTLRACLPPKPYTGLTQEAERQRNGSAAVLCLVSTHTGRFSATEPQQSEPAVFTRGHEITRESWT
ncbi:hypothetical protein D9C73_002827 [Collichthys lucidus]|uniref:Uncharacterized protein n=1 Tax=Collichthys lucidus TaxID=240159 RepID=A0A4U5U3M4_COLLU|nr:hypothetical protein D9C73_002827 [Collichthys lucidus]